MRKFREDMEKLAAKLDMKKRFPGYFEVWVFRGAFLVLIALMLFAMWDEGVFHGPWEKTFVYVECPADNWQGKCKNPFWDEFGGLHEVCRDHPEMCALEYIPAGFVLGHKPGWLWRNFDVLIFVILALAFLLNHVIYSWRIGRW